jgi:hypothetical protein
MRQLRLTSYKIDPRLEEFTISLFRLCSKIGECDKGS